VRAGEELGDTAPRVGTGVDQLGNSCRTPARPAAGESLRHVDDAIVEDQAKARSWIGWEREGRDAQRRQLITCEALLRPQHWHRHVIY
jgi:hypothetical protein